MLCFWWIYLLLSLVSLISAIVLIFIMTAFSLFILIKFRNYLCLSIPVYFLTKVLIHVFVIIQMSFNSR